FALAATVVGDDSVGGPQNGFGGAVVLLQPDDAGLFILFLEIQDIFNGSAAETIDTLIVVADHTDILVLASQERRQQILQMVGVLILVNQDIAELLLIIVQNIWILLQQPDREQNNIIKVHRVSL